MVRRSGSGVNGVAAGAGAARVQNGGAPHGRGPCYRRAARTGRAGLRTARSGVVNRGKPNSSIERFSIASRSNVLKVDWTGG